MTSTTRIRMALAVLAMSGVLGGALAPASGDRTPLQYQRSYEQEAARNHLGALDALAKLPATSRDTYLFHLRRGWLRYLAKDYRGALVAYRKAGERAPAAIEPQLGMMLPQMALRRWKDLAQTARRVLGRDPKNYLGRIRLAYAGYQLGRFEPSRRLYADVLREYPSKADLRAGLGWCLLKLGKGSQSAAQFRAVLAVVPKHRSAAAGLRALAKRLALRGG